MILENIQAFADRVSSNKREIEARGGWRTVFLESGYYPAHAVNTKEWSEMHRWCCDQFGVEHYSWTGSTFWFENEKDVLLFALRWS